MLRKSSLQILLFSFMFLVGLLALNLIQGRVPRQTEALGSSAPLSGAVDVNIFVNLAKKTVPTVVNISSISAVKSPLFQDTPDDVLRKFFGDLFRQYGSPDESPDSGDDEDGISPPGRAPRSRMPKAISLGTGFIIDASGLILTNNHVVADADEIKIAFTEKRDEKPSDAEVVGRDPELDVALIRVKNKTDMTAAALGDSDSLEVGEYVIAVGNPLGHGHSVTHGIISAKDRQIPDFILANYIQTDAPINPGNSGGPLINLKGEVVGINNAIDERARGGIGFAIPINAVKAILPQLRTKGSVARGYIGILVDTLFPEIAAKIGAPKDLKGSVVSHVYPGQPADKAGVKPYDIIIEFNNKPVQTSSDLIAAVTASPVGETVPVKISRQGKEMTLKIRVEQRPDVNTLRNKPVPGRKQQTPRKPGRIDTGMALEDITPELAKELGITGKAAGVLISRIAYGGPADKARPPLMRGDVIVEVEQRPVKNVDDFYSIVKAKKTYLLRVRRTDPQGRELFVMVLLDLKG